MLNTNLNPNNLTTDEILEDWMKDKINLITTHVNDTEQLKGIIDKIYSDGFQDGQDNYQEVKKELRKLRRENTRLKMQNIAKSF